jgi:biotin carboxyl carrier protein
MNSTGRATSEAVRIGVPLLILSAGIGGFFVFGQRPEVARRESTLGQNILVDTAPVEQFIDEMVIEVEGVAVPYRQVTLSAEVSGRVVRKAATSRAGSYVRRDDFLLQIDPTDYQLEVTRSNRDLNKAEQEIESIEVDVENTTALIALADEDLALRKRELRRRQKLFATGSISESELEESQRSELVSRNSLQSMRNQLASSKQRRLTLDASLELVRVQLQRAQVDIQRTGVAAPINGTVTMDHVEEGDFVNRGDPLYLLTEAGQMEVKCSLRVDQLYWLWLQQGASGQVGPAESVFQIPRTDVEVVFEFEGQQYVWQGVLARYEGTGLDTETRMVPCRVQVDEPTQVLRAAVGEETRARHFSLPTLFTGMYVTVRIPIHSPVPLLSLPAAAVRAGGRVWIVRDQKLRIEPVDIAQATADRVIVRQPATDRLRPGDRVVTSPLTSARSGMKVAEAVQP